MKDKFIKSTLILLIGGCLTKILGLVIKMVMGRLVGPEALGLYMLILPTFSLFIGISQFGLPVALSRLVAEDKRNNKRLFFSVIPISLIVNIFLILLIFIFAKTISISLLHRKDAYLGILSIAIVLPFISISSIIRSYFFGKEKMIPHVISNIVEDVIRLIVMIIGIPFMLNKDISYVVSFLILCNVLSEVSSILVLLLFIPKNLSIKCSDLRPSKTYMKESLSLGIPSTCGRLVGSVGYFLEPIILTNVLLYVGYSSNFVAKEYGILSGYVMPILLFPSFFTGAISNALMPVLTREYSSKKYNLFKKKLSLGIILSLGIGFVFMSLFMTFPKLFLSLIYHTTFGSKYMTALAPVCLLQYIQGPLSAALEAMGKIKDVMYSNILGMVVRSGFLIVFSLFRIGIWGLVLAISLNVVATTIYYLVRVYKYLKEKP